jgi:hypothetical protein
MLVITEIYTTADLFNEWPEDTVLVIDFDYEPGQPESGRFGPPENYDPGCSDGVYIEAISIMDDWFADKNCRDMFNVKQMDYIVEKCMEDGYQEAQNMRYRDE